MSCQSMTKVKENSVLSKSISIDNQSAISPEWYQKDDNLIEQQTLSRGCRE
jgi:hypothetical protein